MQYADNAQLYAVLKHTNTTIDLDSIYVAIKDWLTVNQTICYWTWTSETIVFGISN